MNFVFTYWEGHLYPFTELCIKSITKIFSKRHIHLTPENISNWVNLDKKIMDLNHISFKSDFIRSILLQKYGGWWFDSDILLFKNPDESIVDNMPQIWYLIYCVSGW